MIELRNVNRVALADLNETVSSERNPRRPHKKGSSLLKEPLMVLMDRGRVKTPAKADPYR